MKRKLELINLPCCPPVLFLYLLQSFVGGGRWEIRGEHECLGGGYRVCEVGLGKRRKK